jgi:hypothetical protein
VDTFFRCEDCAGGVHELRRTHRARLPDSESRQRYNCGMAGDRSGPRVKGDRTPMHVRVPRTHRAVYERLAKKAGLPLGDYVALRLAQAHDLDEPEYINRSRQQLELPLGA